MNKNDFIRKGARQGDDGGSFTNGGGAFEKQNGVLVES